MRWIAPNLTPSERAALEQIEWIDWDSPSLVQSGREIDDHNRAVADRESPAESQPRKPSKRKART